ncbi:MAG: undecaprenyl/decaprenyl-phosphate alpha-N-acetylglucosaminyl 1-phosphate transferase [Ruminococcaceae bacterium]|nr:undecaprenyl/decaprenyl-phosphate alpha-N-acetylglucosaminyl 1-phosphate transferase [Oscillospiraceae bacterium]
MLPFRRPLRAKNETRFIDVTLQNYGLVLLAFLLAGVLAYAATPLVKKFAYVVGAVDVPRDNRRMHKTPIPRLGGLAIFAGFLISVLIFGEMDRMMTSILIGALLLVTMGILDDILALKAWIKLIVQIVSALIPVIYGGLRIETLSNFNFFSAEPYSYLGVLSVPITVIWIVGLTNAVNFIDGLDGLAAGVSSISAIAMLVISCILGDPAVAVVTAALAGSIFGFLPYNFNPAKIFMGDTGSNFLGFILATLSIQGLFKFYAVISFAVPFLILGLPLFDMLSSIIRRVAKGQSPMAPDRGHIHHRLIDMGLSQKQAVAVLYAITCILGITGVILASSGAGKAILLLLAVILVCTIGFNVLAHSGKKGQGDKTEENSSEAETSDADNAADMVEVTDQAEEKAENEEKTE